MKNFCCIVLSFSAIFFSSIFPAASRTAFSSSFSTGDSYTEYAVATIADSLLSKADVVVRLDSSLVYCRGTSGYSMYSKEVITIMNRIGSEYADFQIATNRNLELKSYSAIILDKNGNVVKKLSKKDLQKTQLSQAYFDDYTTWYLSEPYDRYPYTIITETTVVQSNGFFSFPQWTLPHTPGVSVERSVYTISTPQNYIFNSKTINCAPEFAASQNGDRNVYTWKFAPLKSPEREPFLMPVEKRIPTVLASPADFNYYGIPGNASTWEEYGNWQMHLLVERDELPEPLVAQIHALTDKLSTCYDKAKALYDYMLFSTRYVSIQIGIGGLRPMSAKEVFNTKFGDCKALANYYISMLKEIGIKACYVETGTDCIDFPCEFATPSSTNHAIVKIPAEENDPLPDGDIWVECTSAYNPFGYIHSKIAGHDALCYYNGYAKVEKLPRNLDSLNRTVSNIHVTISAKDSTLMEIEDTYSGEMAEDLFTFGDLSKEDMEKYLKNSLDLPLAKIYDIRFSLTGDRYPQFKIKFKASTPTYGSSSQSRMFIPLSPFGLSAYKLKKERHAPIYVETGFNRIEHITMDIPQGYELEGGNVNQQMGNGFGGGNTEMKKEGQQIRILVERNVSSGTFSEKEYPQLYKLYEFFRKQGNKKIVLINKNNNTL